MPPRPKIIEDEITEVFLKGGSGPGGQKINKCNSKVQLKHLPTGIVVSLVKLQDQENKIERRQERDISYEKTIREEDKKDKSWSSYNH
ncbi:Peptide chain release factor 1 [Cyberlindnera fabianii]|uniref:Peptide chain release factor 1 n=1 Tax=Cyberlindnera fabianii TaxID=36022 RepID=A0A1V2L0R0_CYBFA|nr:Peptide chain release factor 1 [Cyberlindnera fabianii]